MDLFEHECSDRKVLGVRHTQCVLTSAEKTNLKRWVMRVAAIFFIWAIIRIHHRRIYARSHNNHTRTYAAIGMRAIVVIDG